MHTTCLDPATAQRACNLPYIPFVQCPGQGRQSPGHTLVDRLRAMTADVDAGVEPTVALDCHTSSIQLGILPGKNEEEGVPG